MEISFYCQNGAPVLATCANPDIYLEKTAFQFNFRQPAALEAATRAQRETGCPVFLTLDASGLFEGANLSSTLRQHTARLLSRIWTAPAFVFAFYRTESLPAFLQQASFGAYGMDDFLLESLPLVGDECLSAIAWGDLTGVPIYTRAGYERIQNVTLSREEARFLSQVAPRPLLRWLVSKDSRKNARNRFFFAS